MTDKDIARAIDEALERLPRTDDNHSGRGILIGILNDLEFFEFADEHHDAWMEDEKRINHPKRKK